MYVRQAELEALDSDDNSRSSVPAQSQRGPTKPDTTVLSTLQERLEMYQQARTSALNSGDSSKARRLDRGLHVSWLCFYHTSRVSCSVIAKCKVDQQ